MLAFFNVLTLFLFNDLTAIVYKAPGQDNGKIIEANDAAAWNNGAQALSNRDQHSFAKALEHVVGDHQNAKFLAYNNAPPGVPSIKTKSNSKGVIILATNADSAAWVVHTVPGFPAAKTGYNWPVAENARGHLLICLTILESQINAIAASLLLVQPVIYYNDIPQTETAGMPKSESSKYEIYKKVIVKVLKKTIKVWSRRDNILKGDCRGSQRHIRLIKSPAAINGHNTNLEADITNWAVSDPGNIFCHIDKPYFKNQTREPAMAVCIDNNEIFARFNEIAAQVEDCSQVIVYKAPGEANGKIIESTAAVAWQNGAQPLTNDAQHSFATALQHVVGNNPNAKFLAYNNAPPGVPNIKTKSNSKGVIILATNADSAAWIVHTVPGFPAAKTGYNWPLAENARGHLLICLTISESQINAIAASLLLVQPLIHYNDIPKTETAGMPYFNKLAEGKISTLPPFTSRQTIRTQSGAAPVTVHIYSKSESSKYEIYKKVIVKVLKKTIKVWSRRDSKLKGDCRGSQRHIRLIKSPAAINVSHWQHQNAKIQMDVMKAILYKAPAQPNGKILHAGAVGRNWANSPAAVTQNNGHSFAKAIEHVFAPHVDNKFIAYNNDPPDVPKVRTKSNSKGVLMMDITGTDAAAWIVHTVPGFPKARTGYLFPPAEVQKGHLLIC
ncbi:Deoxyribonuclease-2-alpha [Trichinella sp. T8]|nr:Deoxyribonuclease-2-alpha [Trichinella sp. T8]